MVYAAAANGHTLLLAWKLGTFVASGATFVPGFLVRALARRDLLHALEALRVRDPAGGGNPESHAGEPAYADAP
jgi:hypothetical protein